ncbi:MAG: hypothetical protein ACE3L7_32330 [Candidatus Pristimantibacillus sp.]
MTTNNRLGFSLIENAYDSLDHGIEHLEKAVKEDNPFEYKRAVLDFCHAAELLLKEVLFRINPIYVFDKNDLFKRCKDPLNPTINELYTCKSLEVNPLCEAIKKYAPDLSANTGANLNVFSNTAAPFRNKIQHFCFETSEKEVREILLKLSYQLLSPVYKYLDMDKEFDPIMERLYVAFQMENVINYHSEELRVQNKAFDIGSCFSCGLYGLFLLFDNSTGYTNSCHCAGCGFSLPKIPIEEYRVCPECSGYTLIYSSELQGGVCTYYRCANHKDGGILISMEFCTDCHDYKVEEECKCTEDV